MSIQHLLSDDVAVRTMENTTNHRDRHRLLHQHFDELVADYLRWHRSALPSNTTVMDLMQWSFQQTQHPNENIEDEEE